MIKKKDTNVRFQFTVDIDYMIIIALGRWEGGSASLGVVLRSGIQSSPYKISGL